MFSSRPTWTRGLTFWEPDGLAEARPAGATLGTLGGTPPHVRSRFRSRANPRRFALYSLADTSAAGSALVRVGTDDHSLMVVREFRRVPLHASSLSLALFSAQAGRAAGAVAALAHFVERAVSAWEPAYLMLAQSIEQPRVIVLLAGVHDAQALAGALPGPLSIGGLMPELASMLADEPEIFEYCRDERAAELAALVSPHAV